MPKSLVTTLLTALLVLVAAPAYASTSPVEPPGDNSPWVAIVAFVVFAGVVGGMLFIANAYRKNNR